MIKNMIKNKLQTFGLHIANEQAQNIQLELAKRALKTTADYVEENMRNVVSVASRYEVHDVGISNISLQDGLVLEFGVYRGDTINYIAQRQPKAMIYGFDSFEGLPEFWRDGFDKSAFALKSLPKVKDNVTLKKGWFDDTLPSFIQELRTPIAYLHIDCDLYSSTKTIFGYLDKYIIPGTVIVFDEYFNYPSWETGEFQAFQEFIVKTGKSYQYLTYNHLNEQVAVKIIEG